MLALWTTIASAQDVTMKDVFASMPDSIFPYLSHNNRLDMIDFRESGMKAVIDNSLGGKSTLDTLTADYLHLSLNEATTVEMKLVESDRLLDDTTKTIVCLSTTFSGMESNMEFYTSKWHKLPININSYRQGLTARPDTMSIDTYNDLLRLASGYCVVAKLSPSSEDIELTPTFPYANEEEKDKLSSIKKQKTLNFHLLLVKFLNN